MALIARRLAALTVSGARDVKQGAVRAIVHQAVHDICVAPELPTDPAAADGRRGVGQLAGDVLAIGELMLEAAPGSLSEDQAASRLALLCEEIGEPFDRGLAARRFALTGPATPRGEPSCDPDWAHRARK
ncbi:hypothetical protein B7755_043835 [Streptomyces sp. NBS 14/10]|uniref:hypothetical protein n=1 Tax=Streptomyces sp. NBS 14/10 TaxID=1945643 RepID=UPI000B7F9EDC|nr:hypothetical protein [Streptomyces sp. NBS 14/10]KAK1184425.1 hypothetical protein B7755_043835 [Streptomyces sp. NBS 14/10]